MSIMETMVGSSFTVKYSRLETMVGSSSFTVKYSLKEQLSPLVESFVTKALKYKTNLN